MANKFQFGTVYGISGSEGSILTDERDCVLFQFKQACRVVDGQTEPRLEFGKLQRFIQEESRVVFVLDTSAERFGLPLTYMWAPEEDFLILKEEIEALPYYGIFRDSDVTKGPIRHGNIRQLKALQDLPKGVWMRRMYKDETKTMWEPCEDPITPRPTPKVADLVTPKPPVRPEEIIVVSKRTDTLTNEEEEKQIFKGPRDSFEKEYPQGSLEPRFIGKGERFLLEYTVKISCFGNEAVEVDDPYVSLVEPSGESLIPA